MASFYAPVIIIIFANLVFYWQSQRIITQQLIYNRGMQHFQQKYVYITFILFSYFQKKIGIFFKKKTPDFIMIDWQPGSLASLKLYFDLTT